MLYMIATPESGAPTLGRLRQLVMGGESPFSPVPDDEGKPLYPSIFELARKRASETANDELALMATMFSGTNEKEVGYFASTLQSQLGFLAEIAPIAGVSDFDLSELKAGSLTVYLVLPASKVQSHFRWLRLMLMLAVAAMEKGKPPARDVVFLLEEFAALGHLEVIEKAAGLMPGYGVKLWVILQDLTQLQKLYGDSWETFLDNAAAIQAFGNDGLTTTEYLSKRLGQKLYSIEIPNNLSLSGIAGGGEMSSERREWQPLLPAAKIGQVFRRDADGLRMLLLRKGQNPAQISRLPYGWGL